MNHHSFSLLRKVATRLTMVCCALLCLTLLGSSKKVRRPRHKKLEALYQQPWGTRIDRVDLSGEGLTEVPCLSMYDIRQLDLSHNKIRNIAWRNLPTKVENINLSHNLLADTLVWDEFFTPEIHNLDLSHNRLKLFVPFFRFMDTLNLANNDLRCYVEFTYASMFPCDKISFVDVSGNPQLSTNILSYYGEKTSTFRHNGTPWDRTPPKRDEKAGAALAKKLKFTHRIWNAL